GGLLGGGALLGVARFDLGAAALEHLAVGVGGAERLLLRQQVIASVAVTDAHFLADAAKIFDAFKQGDLHGPACYWTANGSRASSRASLMARASSRCFLAETAVMRAGTILPFSLI